MTEAASLAGRPPASGEAATCAAISLAADEPLGGTGIVADRWLCVESRSAWGRDAIVDGGFAVDVAADLAARAEKVLAIRRPARRGVAPIAFAAETSEDACRLARIELERPGDLLGRDAWDEGEPVGGLLLLVCAHGRRDACCSRLGLPVFAELDRARGPELVWQCSHTGGHRFAANVVVLPFGVTLGRVPSAAASGIAAALTEGRVPLDLYRGRSVYAPPVQAAEVAVRRSRGLDRLADLRLERTDGGLVRFATRVGEIEARVAERPGPVLSKSCGATPEPTVVFDVEL